MKFSVCIPNFNYEKYLRETLESVVSQHFKDFEVVVSDNASTDKSLEIIQDYENKYPYIRYKVNHTNVGFAGNLDKSAEMAKGEWMIMLSSDDLMTPEALSDYHTFLKTATNKYGSQLAFCSSFDKIDADGNFLEYLGPSNRIWKNEDIDPELSELLNCKVYKIDAGLALNRCLAYYYNPFNFASTCYHHTLYKEVEGYGGSRLMNPDKWFHWKILVHSTHVFFIDKPLFKYRWHNSNQTNSLLQSGALKFFMDEYRSSFEISEPMLEKAGLSQDEVKRNFVHRSILPYTFKYIKSGQRVLALRILFFGLAGYPSICLKSRKTYTLIILLALGKIGSLIAKSIK